MRREGSGAATIGGGGCASHETAGGGRQRAILAVVYIPTGEVASMGEVSHSIDSLRATKELPQVPSEGGASPRHVGRGGGRGGSYSTPPKVGFHHVTRRPVTPGGGNVP